MKRTDYNIRQLNPWLRGALVLYLLSTLFLVVVHQHHDGLQGHDCALCTVAHTPAVAQVAAVQDTAPVTPGILLPAPEIRGWDSDPASTLRSRAPPLV
jgi:hypothetical protein